MRGQNQQKFSNHLGELMIGKVILSYLPYWLETEATVLPKGEVKTVEERKVNEITFSLSRKICFLSLS